MRRVDLLLTGLILALAAAACGAGGDNPAVTASPAGQSGRGDAGWAVRGSPGWRIVQALPSEPGSGQPGGGSDEMLSVAAAGARDVWAVGQLCPQQATRACVALLRASSARSSATQALVACWSSTGQGPGGARSPLLPAGGR